MTGNRIPPEPVGDNELFLASVNDGLRMLDAHVFEKSETEVISWLKSLEDREVFVHAAGLATLRRMLERVKGVFSTELAERGYDGDGLAYRGVES